MALSKSIKQHLRHVTELLASFRDDVPVSEQKRAVEDVMDAVEKVGSPSDAISKAFAAAEPATTELNSKLERDFRIAQQLLNDTFARMFGTVPEASPAPPAPPKRPTLIGSFKAGFNARSQPLKEVADQAAGNIGVRNTHSSMGIRHRIAETMGKASAWAVDPAAMTSRRDLKRAVKDALRN